MLYYGVGIAAFLVVVMVVLRYYSNKESFENPTYNYAPPMTMTDNGVAELLPEHESLDPVDLLPLDQNDEDFKKSNPFAEGELQNKDFLEAGRTVGILSEALKNSVIDIRGVPPIERKQLSPWNNSIKTYYISQSIGDHI